MQPASSDGWSSRRDDRGSMLIVALGILTLLSLLALTFVSIMKLERTASTNYVDGVRARLIAEGGLEMAGAQIRLRASGEPFSDPTADWIYAQGNYWVPIEEASPIRRGTPEDSPALNAVRASFAGALGVTYASGLDQYKVKVIDTQTQFNLNQQFEVLNDVDQVYCRWLDSLGVAISKLNVRARSGGTVTGAGGGRNPVANARYPKGTPNAWRGGEAIFRFRQAREGRRFNSKTELMEVLASEDDFNLLQDYITTRSWFDPTTVSAISQDGLNKKPWTDVQRKEQRSPINVNLATTEVIAANLAGIAGRAIFLYTGDYDTRTSRQQDVDAGTTYVSTQYKEETSYGTTGVLVYISPFGWTPGAAAGDPPAIGGALDLAKRIKDRITTTGPFKTFAEWEDWVDTTCTDSYLETWRDPDTSQFGFPGHDRGAGNPRMLQLDEAPLTTPSEADVKRQPRYKAWFYNCVRSMLKSNMNPNARLSGWNPDACVHMPVDKGGLLYFVDPTQPAATKGQRQTLEWCLGSKGIFEITSLGEVLGPPPVDVTKGTDRIIYAQGKVQAVLQLFDTKVHTSQRDFERKGNTFLAERGAMASYPVPKIYWDPRAYGGPQVTQWLEEGRGEYLQSSDFDGHIQLATRSHEASGNDPSSGITFDTTVVDLGQKRFELLFQDRRVESPGGTAETQRDPLMADSSGAVRHHDAGQVATGRIGNGWGWPFGSARDGVEPGTRLREPRVEWRWDVLTPDGYYNSALRRTQLWYRASDENSAALAGQPDGRLRGKSMPTLTSGGNVAPTPKGGFELWYKPDFDWAVQSGSGGSGPAAAAVPDQRYCGLLATSHILQNPTAYQGGASRGQLGSWTRGTQMFVTRNTSGDLRITRLYFEVVGPAGDPQEEPYVEDPKAPGSFIAFSTYYDRVKTDYAYAWPPKELLTIPAPFTNIKWARTDHWVPFQTLKDWRAHEWHHLAAYWDDYAGTVQLWLDGRPTPLVARAPTQLGPRYQPKVPNPAGPTQPPVPGPQGNPPGPAELPAFVRLNARTGPTTPPAGQPQEAYEEGLRPKDQIIIGSIGREQAVIGGLFKHERDASLPANGTVDEVRFFDGSRTGAMTALDRYEAGEWANEFDLSSAFADGVAELGLASVNFTAYLPRRHAGRQFPNGSGSVMLEFRVVEQGKTWSDPKHSFPATTYNAIRGGDASISLTDAAGLPVRVLKTDRLLYRFTVTPATDNGFAVASPVVDDISLVYYLPNPVVLLKERVNN